MLIAMKTTPNPLPPPPRTAQVADKYIVRFPDGMRDRIAEAAKANNRSMNAEIVARLEQTLAGNHGAASAGASLLITEHNIEQVAELLVRRLSEKGLAVTTEAIEIPTKRVPRTRPEKIIK